MNEQYLHFKKAFHAFSFPGRVIPFSNTINLNYSKWVKMISAGFIIYSSYCYFKRTPSSNRFHFLKTLFSWTLKKNSKNNKICNANIELQVKEIPEHVKYDGGWYAEFDELKQSESDNVVAAALEPIRETTPRGEIIMCYDADNKSFNYYSNNKNIPYSTLDAVARKYVCLHKVPSIYVDIRDEIQKGHEKNIKKEKKMKASSSSSSSSSSTSSIVKKKLFAVFKNYKTGTTATPAPASLDLKGPKSINKNETNVGKEIVLKDNVNKFIYKGLVEEYDADLKLKQLKLQQEYNEKSNTDSNSNSECNVDNCETGENKNLSYADFKNKYKINQNQNQN